MRVALACVGVVLLLIVGGLGLRWALAPATGAVEQREQTVGDGSYRISAYDAFYDDCASAKSTQQQLEQAIATRDAEPEGTNRRAQLDANVAALTNVLITAVNQYNADARKADTRAHFRASDLPYQLPELDATDPTKEKITCDA